MTTSYNILKREEGTVWIMEKLKETNRLAELRKRKGITQAQLGDAVGLTQSMIAYIEAGSREPSRDYKIKLAKYFGVTVEYLFYEPFYDLWS